MEHQLTFDSCCFAHYFIDDVFFVHSVYLYTYIYPWWDIGSTLCEDYKTYGPDEALNGAEGDLQYEAELNWFQLLHIILDWKRNLW